jgi:hypothetical protein
VYGDAADIRVPSRTMAEAEEILAAVGDAHAGYKYIGISPIDGNPGWVHGDWRNY